MTVLQTDEEVLAEKPMVAVPALQTDAEVLAETAPAAPAPLPTFQRTPEQAGQEAVVALDMSAKTGMPLDVSNAVARWSPTAEIARIRSKPAPEGMDPEAHKAWQESQITPALQKMADDEAFDNTTFGSAMRTVLTPALYAAHANFMGATAIIEGAVRILGQTKLGDALKAAQDEAAKTQESGFGRGEYRPTGAILSERVPEAVGGFLPYIAVGQVGGPIAAVATFGLQGFARTYDEATAAGKDPATAYAAALVRGGADSLTSFVLGGLMGKLDALAGGGFSGWAKKVAVDTFGLGLMNALMTTEGNAVAKVVYDENRPLFEGTVDAGEQGMIAGAVIALVKSAVRIKGGVEKPKEVAKEPAKAAPEALQAPAAAGEAPRGVAGQPEAPVSAVEAGLGERAGEQGAAPKTLAEKRALALKVQQEVEAAATAPKVEAPKPGPETTSIKKAVTAAERLAREAEPLTAPASETKQQWIDEAKARVEADPQLPERLVQKLQENPKGLDAVDISVLQRYKRGLKTATENAAEKLFSALKGGDETAIAEAQKVVDGYEAKLDALDKAARTVSSTWGKSGVALQAELAQDFSLAGMIRKRKVAKGSDELSRAELENIKVEHERLVKVESELVAREKVLAEREAGVKETRARKRVEKIPLAEVRPSRVSAASPRFGESNTLFTKAGANEAMAWIKQNVGRLNIGADPVALEKLVKVGGYYFEGGIRNFEAWSAQFAADFAEIAAKIKPMLGTIWKQIHSQRLGAIRERLSTKHARETAKGREPRGLTGDIQELFKIETARGLSRDDAVTAVHDFLKTLEPDITRRETMDAISGYGKWRMLDRDELNIEVRQKKGELQELAKLEDMASGKAPAKTGFERQDPSDARRELIKKVNDAKREGGYNIPDPETQLKSAVQSLRTRLEHEITDMTAKIKAGDFEKKPRPEPLPIDKETAALKFRRDALKQTIDEENFKLVLARRTLPQKIWEGTRNVVGLMRAFKSAIDLSALLRQNFWITVTHPILTAKKIVPVMFKTLTKKGEHAHQQEIASRENAPLYKRDGLDLAEAGHTFEKMEEAYQSRYAEKVPGVAMSQRSYTAALNESRASSYDALAASFSKTGVPTPAEGKLIAHYVNAATGRGGGGKLASTMAALATGIWSPRLIASRLQLLIGEPIWNGLLTGKIPLKGTVKVRLMIAGEYARFLGGMAVIYGLSSAAGLEIGYDPRSSHFGKIKVGKTWLDPLAGLSQMIVFLSRMVTGKKTTKTGTRSLRGKDVEYGAGDIGDEMWRFARTKFSPALGTAVNLLAGENVMGEPTTPTSVVSDAFMPMAPQDIYNTMKANGVPEATILSVLSFFGASLQTYDEKKN